MEQSYDPNSDLYAAEVIELRMCVAYLGENGEQRWLESLWFSSQATAFLDPVYGKHSFVACFKGATEAARIVHDSRVGVGSAYHLFRLPSSIERRVHGLILKRRPLPFASSVNEAADRLASFVKDTANLTEGPQRVGSATELASNSWVASAASLYLTAFRNGTITFPYFADA